MVVYQVEFNKTRWSCKWNSDRKQYAKHRGVVGVKVVESLG